MKPIKHRAKWDPASKSFAVVRNDGCGDEIVQTGHFTYALALRAARRLNAYLRRVYKPVKKVKAA